MLTTATTVNPLPTVIIALSLRRKCNILSRTVCSSFSTMTLFKKKINIKQQGEIREEEEYWGKKVKNFFLTV